MIRLKEIIKNINYRRLCDFADCDIHGVCADSRKVGSGYLFVALKGRHYDGHNFAEAALVSGAKALVLERDLALKEKVNRILVNDSRLALALIAANFFGHPAKKLKLTGITGTNGKTTTSYLIEKILQASNRPSAVAGTVNYRIGKMIQPAVNTTPQAERLQSFLQQAVELGSEYAIIEVSSHALDQGRIAGLDFAQAVFTNLSAEHLDYHGDIDSYFACKSRLFKGLNASSWAIINKDDPYGKRLIKLTPAKVLTYGLSEDAAVRAGDISLKPDGIKAAISTPAGTIEIESRLLGRHNVYNILAASAWAFAQGIALPAIAAGIKDCGCVCGRLERVDCGQDFFVFIDYAHTDDALRNILTALRQISKRKIILVFGCGGDRDRSKRSRMGRIASELADIVIITTDNPRSEDPGQINAEILQGLSRHRQNCRVVIDRSLAIEQALGLAKSKDIVVIAGKGHESRQIFADKIVPFSDRRAVEKALRCLV